MTGYKIIILLLRITLAALFLFSGYVKGIDYIGTAIKIEEYLNAFNMGWLSFGASSISIILSGFEILIGVLLLFNILPRLTRMLTMVTMSVFLILTLFIAIFNPVNDCGCFGDAIPLSNTATLIKNIIFWILAVGLWRGYENYRKIRYNKTFAVTLSVILSFSIPLFSYFIVNDMDFLPYRIGTNINEAMFIPEDAPKNEYETILHYKNKKNGEVKEFAIDDTEWHDTEKWEFVNTENIITKEGYTPKIASFELVNDFGNNVAPDVLTRDGYMLFVVEPQMGDLTYNEYLEIGNYTDFMNIIVLTTSNTKDSKKRVEGILNNDIEMYNIDSITLKSLLRAKKGVVLLKDGTIIAKRNFSHLFTINEDEFIDFDTIIRAENRSTKLIFYSYISLLLLILSITTMRRGL